MAGDLFIESITFDEFTLPGEAHATIDAKIYHADKPLSVHRDTLVTRLNAAVTVQNRAGLPAHAYVTFRSADRWRVAAFAAPTATGGATVGRTRLDVFLKNAHGRPAWRRRTRISRTGPASATAAR